MKKVIEQKAMFIKQYGDILYLTRDYKINYENDIIEEKIRNKLRLYSKYFDNHIKNNDEILIDLPKVKTIKK